MRGVMLDAEWAPRARLEPHARHDRLAPGNLAWRRPSHTLTDLPEPEPATDEVVVEVAVCGVCSADTRCYETDDEGYVCYTGPLHLPVTPGHEVAGRVVATGAAVRRVRPGELVAVSSSVTCGVCPACRADHPQQCVNLRRLGLSAPGGFAERLVASERQVWSLDRLAERLGSQREALELGALLGPLGCAYGGLFAGAGLRPGEHVAVFGCGAVGLAAVALARLAGAVSVTAFDPSPARCALALELGADEAHDPRKLDEEGSSPADELRRATGGQGVDVTVEASGHAERTLSELDVAVAPGGRVCLLACNGERVYAPLDGLLSRGATVAGPDERGGWAPLLRLMEAGRFAPRAMITDRRPLDEAVHALVDSTRRSGGRIILLGPLALS